MKTEIVLKNIDDKRAYFGVDWLPEAQEYRYTFAVSLSADDTDASMNRMFEVIKDLLKDQVTQLIMQRK